MAPHSLIGLSGALGSGKTTIANRLVSAHKFTAIGVADALKEEVIRCFPGLLALEVEYWLGDALREGYTTLPEAIEHLVWVQKPPRIRLLLQEFGSGVRRADDPEYWVHRWRERASPILELDRRVVVPDVRFPGEAQMVRELHGRLIKVLRPGYDGDDHQSERALDTWEDWDCVVVNDGTLDELVLEADSLVGES